MIKFPFLNNLIPHVKSLKKDIYSGFIVFLIALPLSLGIAMASGFPPFAGILTAALGGLLVTFFTNAPLTIKGPAAGLIAIAAAAVQELGKGDATAGYHLALACIVAAGLIQIGFGYAKGGVLGDFIPLVIVHGMLAAIGIIIIAKQIHVLMGVTPLATESLGLIKEIPKSIAKLNPIVFFIGTIGLIIMIFAPKIKLKWVKKIPVPLTLLLITIPLGLYFSIEVNSAYFFNNKPYPLGEQFLVNLPFSISNAFQFPDFSGFMEQPKVMIKYSIMFALVGSIESLLTCKAMDIIDEKRRKTNLNKDLSALGLGNTVAGLLGGLPMISEVLRSSANYVNGAQSKWSNFFHGLFVMLFVVLLPNLIHHIPLSALAAILIYTGFQLTAPLTFFHAYKVGLDQLIMLVLTITIVLATDLLIGVFAGVLLKLLFLLFKGLPFKNIFKSEHYLEKTQSESLILLVKSDLVFTNLYHFKTSLKQLPPQKNILIDLRQSKLVDYTVLEYLHNFRVRYQEAGGTLVVER